MPYVLIDGQALPFVAEGESIVPELNVIHAT